MKESSGVPITYSSSLLKIETAKEIINHVCCGKVTTMTREQNTQVGDGGEKEKRKRENV
jgi:hypothetical protein